MSGILGFPSRQNYAWCRLHLDPERGTSFQRKS